MAGYFSMKMKRKDLEEVNGEFSDFSLSSPSRKIRRLDAELPPITEDEELEIPLVFEQSMSKPNFASNPGQLGGPVIEELPAVPMNEERAMVLFKPINTPLLQSPSDLKVTLNSDILAGFKNQLLWSSHSNLLREDNEAAMEDEISRSKNGYLAVVPWVPSQLPSMAGVDVPEMVNAEETEAAKMDIEDNSSEMQPGQSNGVSGTGISVSEGLHHWQQQHCMISQLPRNTSTPIVWFW